MRTPSPPLESSKNGDVHEISGEEAHKGGQSLPNLSLRALPLFIPEIEISRPLQEAPILLSSDSKEDFCQCEVVNDRIQKDEENDVFPMASNENALTSSEDDIVSDSDLDYQASEALIDSEGTTSNTALEKIENEVTEDTVEVETAHCVPDVLPSTKLSKLKTTSTEDIRSKKPPVSSLTFCID